MIVDRPASRAVLRTGCIFDTPPLKGNCLDTLVSPQIPMKRKQVLSGGLSIDTTVLSAWRLSVAEPHIIEQHRSGKLRGRQRRATNLSTKLTAAEARAVHEA